MFFACEREIYSRPQLVEVICQLRFPTILSISANEPAAFQERIRRDYPRYARKLEKLPPRLVGTPGNLKMEEQAPMTNYQFVSADGLWKVNLTNQFLALACSRYSCWESFAGQLDAVLAQFIDVYQPSYFERIGLRYVNVFSRRSLGLEGVPFTELIEPGYLGLLAEEDVREGDFLRATQDVEMKLSGGCRLKLHVGPGLMKRPGVEDKELKFILDQDVYLPGRIEMKHSAGALSTVHAHAGRIFRGAITQRLHEAMEPRPV